MKPDEWEKIQAIFHEALQRPPAERDDYVASATGGDRALGTRVNELLSAHFADPDFLETPLEWPERAALDVPSHGHERIGPYQIVRPLGEGGMGVVYLANHSTPEFTRSVAIKVVRPGMDTDDVLRRFDTERQILASLNHAHIAQLYDAGATPDGRPYFVMEFVDGDRIDEWVTRTRPSLEQRLRLFQQICGAVQYAHQNLVVHRDLKPGNVLVTPDGSAKLVDFGIGRILSDSSAPSGDVTHTQARVLTPDYAAPEQFTGSALTTAVDVYSLGVLLFELLTGRRPGRERRNGTPVGTDPTSATASRPSDAVRRREDLSPTDRARRARALRGDLDNIVAKAIRDDPARRYGSAAELAADIDRHLAGRTVQARPDSLAYRASTFARRNPWLLATAATVLVASTGFAVTTGIQSARIARERDKAQEVQSFLLETFGASTAEGAEGDSVSVRQLLDGQRDIVSTLYAADPEMEAEMLSVLAEAYERLGLYDPAAELATRALEASTALRGGDHPDVAHGLNVMGWIVHRRGDSAEGAELLARSVAMWRRLGERDPSGLARALNDLGSVLDQRGETEQAESVLREALALRQTVDGEYDRGVAVTSSNLAVLLYRQGDHAGADSLGQLALERLRSTVGPDHQRTFVAQSNLATFRWVAGDLEGAAELHEDLLERTTRIQGGDNPRTASAMVTYASLLRAQGRANDAETMLREALQIQEASLDPSHPDIGNTTRILGVILQQSGRPEEGLDYLERATQVNRSAYGPTHPLVGESLVGVGIAHEQLGRVAAALSAYAEAAEILSAARGPDHATTRDAKGRLDALRAATNRESPTP